MDGWKNFVRDGGTLFLKLAESMNFMKRKMGATNKTATPGNGRCPTRQLTKFESIGESLCEAAALASIQNRETQAEAAYWRDLDGGRSGRFARLPPHLVSWPPEFDWTTEDHQKCHDDRKQERSQLVEWFSILISKRLQNV